MPIITLTTDFGDKDGFVGTMKGVIWSICPEAQIADITHAVSPQNILEGAFCLWRACYFFPAETIHVAVVDPGVGTSRRPIAARLGAHTFVGPDNGIFTPMIEDAERNSRQVKIIHLTKEKYFLQEVSRTFHGRDIFSPVAAHLARGVPITDLGSEINDPLRNPMPKPERTPHGWRIHITVIDTFGNCTTDLPAASLTGSGEVTFHIGGHVIRGLVGSYGNRPAGEPVALVDSENCIEIAVVNGSAARLFGVKVGDVVEVVESAHG
jgi:hypothetical protein